MNIAKRKIGAPKYLILMGLILVGAFSAFLFFKNPGNLTGYLNFSKINLPTSNGNSPVYNVRYGLCYEGDCEKQNPDYVVITRPLFMNALQDFIKWKTDNGYKVGIITAEYIDKNYPGANTAIKMKNFIAKFVNKKTQYFLLVGDTEVKDDFKFSLSSPKDALENTKTMYDLSKPWNVPSGYVVLSEDISAANVSTMLSDLYFADLNNWDANNDGINDTQLFSEIFDFEAVVGRWPVRTPAELQNIINKSMKMVPTNLLHFWGSDEFKWFKSESDLQKICANISQEYLKQGSVTIECILPLILGHSPKISYKVNYIKKEDAALGNFDFVKYFFNTSEAVYANFHGSKSSIEGLTVYDMDKFKKIIPLYVPLSCLMIHWYWGASDALSEALLKALNGPAIIAVPPNNYAFFKNLEAGTTVGQAFYNVGDKNWAYNRWYSSLLGDPSLKPFSMKTSYFPLPDPNSIKVSK